LVSAYNNYDDYISLFTLAVGGQTEPLVAN